MPFVEAKFFVSQCTRVYRSLLVLVAENVQVQAYCDFWSCALTYIYTYIQLKKETESSIAVSRMNVERKDSQEGQC